MEQLAVALSPFAQAVAALDAGDLVCLEALLNAHPALVTEHGDRSEATPPYFRGATLLHHVAANPIRYPIAPNAVAVGRMLIGHGADVNAATDDGSTTFGLVITSKQASDADLSRPLIELLVFAGATVNLVHPDNVAAALLNAAPRSAEALLAMGSAADIRWSAGLGRLDEMDFLRESAKHDGTMEEALLFASVRGQVEVARRLVAWGARGDVALSPLGISARSALHEAAKRGHLEIVKLLVSAHADRSVPDGRWGGTAADWAMHGGHPEIAALLRGETG